MRKQVVHTFALYFILLFANNSYGQSLTPTGADYIDWNKDVLLNNDYFSLTNSECQDIVSKNLVTGNADVNIPLFKNVINNIDFGVSLSYNTGGIIVDRVASEIGLGWELNAGPYITRQVRDLPDESQMMASPALVFYYGMPQYVWGRLASNSGTGHGYWYGTIGHVIDAEPDIFYLHLDDKIVKFMFSKSGDLLTIPETNILISRVLQGSIIVGNTIPNYPNSTTLETSGQPMYDGSLEFLVTDEHGNKYYFKSVNQTVDYAYVTDKWMPSWIKTYDNHEIDYTYYSPLNRMITNSISQFAQSRHDTVRVKTSPETKIYKYQQLSTIKYDNGLQVFFQYDGGLRCDINNSHRLSKVVISESPNSSGTPAKSYSYNFNQAYFLSGTPIATINETLNESATEVPITYGCTNTYDDTTQLRLKLKSIDKIGFDNTTTKRYYTFNYLATPLPPRLYGGTDMYGYSNGEIPQNMYTITDFCNLDVRPVGSNITKYLYFQQIGLPNAAGTGSTTLGMNRQTHNFVYLPGASSLNKITNENNGSISFEYDLAKHMFSGNQEIGGLVIKSITESDGYTTQNNKIFKYEYSSPTKFVAADGTFDLTATTLSQDWSVCASSADLGEYNWHVYTNRALLLNTGWGPRNVFGSVKESIYDNSNTLLGYTTWSFDNGYSYFGNYVAGFAIYSPLQKPFTNKQFVYDWEIGQPIEKAVYDKNSNKVEDILYTYTKNRKLYGGVDDRFGGIHTITNYNDITFGWQTDLSIDTYYPVTGFMALTQKEERHYYTNALYTSKITSYEYDDNPLVLSFTHNYPMNNLVKEKYTNSKGETIRKNYYYNYSYGAYTSVPAVQRTITDRVQTLLYTDVWKQDATGTNSLINADVPGYVVSSSLSTTIVKPNGLYSLATGAPLTIAGYQPSLHDIALGVSTPNMELKFHANKLNYRGNAIEVTDKASSKFNASIFDDQTDNLLAEVSGAQYSEIAYCGFESDFAWPSTYMKGNCSFNATAITNSHYLLGRSSFHCSTSGGTTLNTVGSLTLGKSYTVSFWALSGSSVTANNGPLYPISMTAIATYTVPATTETWTLYRGVFSSMGSIVNILGEGYIDEIKLYPSKSIMKTHNYLPLIGKTGDVDENDNITSYEYDPFGNLSIIRDQNGNVISKTITVTQGF